MYYSQPSRSTNLNIQRRKMCFHFLTRCVYSGGILLFLLFFTSKANAENSNPLGMTVSFSKPNPKIGDTLDVVFKANIPAGWHLYGAQSDCPVDDGPMRAMLYLDSSEGFQVLGDFQEIGSHLVKEMDVWKCTTSEFKDSCEFHIRIFINGPITGLKAHLYAQKCSDSDGMCLMVKETIPVPLVLNR